MPISPKQGKTKTFDSRNVVTKNICQLKNHWPLSACFFVALPAASHSEQLHAVQPTVGRYNAMVFVQLMLLSYCFCRCSLSACLFSFRNQLSFSPKKFKKQKTKIELSFSFY